MALHQGSCALLLAIGLSASTMAQEAIHFDLPATTAATDVTPEASAGQEKWVAISFRLSMIADSLPTPQAEQLTVQIVPLGGRASVVDYSPRTELNSRYASDIEVSKSREVTDHVGLNLDASYGHLARGTAGMERGTKQVHSTKYQRVAPLHVVVASGTTHRGMGAYFKLRADDQQVLEGDKLFEVVFKVPSDWRGEMIEFRAIAESTANSFTSGIAAITGAAPKPQTLGLARFMVASYLDGDLEMANLAMELSQRERELRAQASAAHSSVAETSGNKLQYTSFRLDPQVVLRVPERQSVTRTLDRVWFGKVDPYTDRDIAQLPVPTRVAILDYLDAREAFVASSRSQE